MWIVWGQQAVASETLEAAVVEYGSGIPLAGARIGVDAGGVHQDLVADPRGRFTVEVASWPAEVRISADDHQDLVETVDATFDGRFRVRRYGWDDEVVVVGASTRDVDRTVVTIDELRRIPGSFGDPVRALQSLPSVTRGSDLSGDIVARGSEAFNTAAMIDEVRVPFLFHFVAGRSVVSPDLVEDVEFFPGALPARFGDVSQAVLNARTRFDPAEPGLHGKVHADLLEAGGSIAAELGRGWTLRAGARRSWLATVANAGYWAVRTAQGATTPEYRPPTFRLPYGDHQLRILHRTGPDVLSATVLGANDGLILVPDRHDGPDPDQKADPVPEPKGPYDHNDLFLQRFERVSLRWDHHGDDLSASSSVTGGYDLVQNLLPGLGLVGSGGVQFARWTQGYVGAAGAVDDELSDAFRLRTGVDATVQPGRLVAVLADGAVTTATRVWAGPFADLTWRPGPLQLTPGLRLSVHRLLGPAAVVPEPRVAARAELGGGWSWTGYVGSLSQGPTLQQAGIGYAGQPLGVVRALQLTTGIEAQLGPGLSFALSVYDTEMRDLVVRDTRLQLGAGPAATEPVLSSFIDLSRSAAASAPPADWVHVQRLPVYEDETGRAYGLEASLRLQPRGDAFGWVAGSLGRSLRQPERGPAYPSTADVPYNLMVVGGTGLGRGWRVSGRGQVSAGLVYTPQIGVFFPDYDHYDSRAGDPNSERFPWYRRLDLRIDHTWTRPRARWTGYLDVYNATNAHNPLYATYDREFQEPQVSVWVPILPTLGLEVEY